MTTAPIRTTAFPTTIVQEISDFIENSDVQLASVAALLDQFSSAQKDKLSKLKTRACLHSSLQPKDRGNDVDHGGEARISLFVARGNAPKPFHLTEEIFDEMTPCVFVLVMRGMPVGSLAKRDDSLNVSTRQAVAQPTCVERLVADEGQAIDAGHKSIEACDVVAMARQQHEADQIAERIYDGRDLRRPTAARFANGLFLSPPFAPVPC